MTDDFPTYQEKKRGWWTETRATVPCILPADGQLAVFKLSDVEKLMDEKYPHKGTGENKKWYFNSTYDREIAEIMDGRVYATPNVLWEHYLPPRKAY